MCSAAIYFFPRVVAKEIMLRCRFPGTERKGTGHEAFNQVLGVAALGAVLGLIAAASAQTVHRHARHPAAAGRQIIVHPRELDVHGRPARAPSPANTTADALDTFAPPGKYMPDIDHTFVGQRGLERWPNNFTVPGCCVP